MSKNTQKFHNSIQYIHAIATIHMHRSSGCLRKAAGLTAAPLRSAHTKTGATARSTTRTLSSARIAAIEGRSNNIGELPGHRRVHSDVVVVAVCPVTVAIMGVQICSALSSTCGIVVVVLCIDATDCSDSVSGLSGDRGPHCWTVVRTGQCCSALC